MKPHKILGWISFIIFLGFPGVASNSYYSLLGEEYVASKVRLSALVKGELPSTPSFINILEPTYYKTFIYRIGTSDPNAFDFIHYANFKAQFLTESLTNIHTSFSHSLSIKDRGETRFQEKEEDIYFSLVAKKLSAYIDYSIIIKPHEQEEIVLSLYTWTNSLRIKDDQNRVLKAAKIFITYHPNALLNFELKGVY